MPFEQPILAIGLMSGTSMDGVDCAIIKTDGLRFVEPISSLTIPYSSGFRFELLGIQGGHGAVDKIDQKLTHYHAEAVQALLRKTNLKAKDISLIGFHGHTILHLPQKRRTWQIGDAQLLASLTKINIVADFRSNDVAAGGQGAPLAPIFHSAIAPGKMPLCLINIGGVANVTWIGAKKSYDMSNEFSNLLAFDTGPGNALIDDWVLSNYGKPFDRDGLIAARGSVDRECLDFLMSNTYFKKSPPKSLGRDDFENSCISTLSPADGAATLTEFSANAIKKAECFLPDYPRQWIVTGGGRNNIFLMKLLRRKLNANVLTAEEVGLNGDSMEAEAFAYLGVRSLRKLPLSGPTTTGVASPMTGGKFYNAY
ncbi:MAG: anhydro-N-acetylmuramic acid kinase [Alphaproteobacteria bacterium]|jgi:anhydro-N-acetylmuramic acid kinase|nr:anhydro-N-acetylmuramic acid kinase [Alphaproteobacteria bacterium]